MPRYSGYRLFPTGKIGLTECSHCKQVLRKKEFSGYVRKRYETLKSKVRPPFWTFSGAIIAVALIVWGVVISQQDKEQDARFIVDPRKGDVYEVWEGSEHYTLCKVESVVGDTVFLLPNRYETNKISGLENLKNEEDSSYVPYTFPLLKKDLKAMFDKGEILGVDRQ